LAEAQYHVGRCYDHGIGTIEDKTKAVHWYTKVCFGHRHVSGTHVQLALHCMRFVNLGCHRSVACTEVAVMETFVVTPALAASFIALLLLEFVAVCMQSSTWSVHHPLP